MNFLSHRVARSKKKKDFSSYRSYDNMSKTVGPSQRILIDKINILQNLSSNPPAAPLFFGFPVVMIRYMFITLALQIHVFAVFLQFKLIKSWMTRGAKRQWHSASYWLHKHFECSRHWKPRECRITKLLPRPKTGYRDKLLFSKNNFGAWTEVGQGAGPA